MPLMSCIAKVSELGKVKYYRLKLGAKRYLLRGTRLQYHHTSHAPSIFLGGACFKLHACVSIQYQVSSEHAGLDGIGALYTMRSRRYLQI